MNANTRTTLELIARHGEMSVSELGVLATVSKDLGVVQAEIERRVEIDKFAPVTHPQFDCRVPKDVRLYLETRKFEVTKVEDGRCNACDPGTDEYRTYYHESGEVYLKTIYHHYGCCSDDEDYEERFDEQ